jgi:hypothetical protein
VSVETVNRRFPKQGSSDATLSAAALVEAEHARRCQVRADDLAIGLLGAFAVPPVHKQVSRALRAIAGLSAGPGWPLLCGRRATARA